MLLLPASVYHAIRNHAEHAYPRECCGALLGNPGDGGWRIAAALPAQNASSAPHRYEIAPAELVRIAHFARRQNLEIAGFYHSHPGAPAHWSSTDLAEAHWLGASYLITAVHDGTAAETLSFQLAGSSEDDKHFLPDPLALTS